MATIIDALLVTLGLDASNFKKGTQQVGKATDDTVRKAKTGAEEITKSFAELGRNITGLFLGFESASGLLKFLGGLNKAEADLGRTSKNIGMSSHELNKWGQAVKLAGGDAADAQAAFGQLAKEFVQLTTNPQAGVGPLLALAKRFGVVTQTNGKLRDQGQILEDLADRTAHLGSVYQHVLFTGAGLSEKEANYLELSTEKRRDLLSLAERNNHVDDDSVRKAQELQEYWRNIGEEIEGYGQELLSTVTPALVSIFKIVGGIDVKSEEWNTGIRLVGSAALFIKTLFSEVGDAVGGVAAAIGALLHGDFKGALNILNDQSAQAKQRQSVAGSKLADIWGDQYDPNAKPGQPGYPSASVTPYESRSLRNNNPGNLKYAHQPGTTGADAQGFAIFSTSLFGAGALDSQLDRYASQGVDSIAAIVEKYEGRDAPGNHNNIQAYQQFLSKFIGKGVNDQLSHYDRLRLSEGISKYEANRKEGGAAAAIVANAHAAKTASMVGPTPGVGAGAGARVAGGDTNTTTVTIENMQVNAPNADATAVANQTAAAIQRKLATSQGVVAQS